MEITKSFCEEEEREREEKRREEAMAADHEWHQVTFRKPTNCQLCRSLLWGLVNQGVVCKGID